MHLKIGGLLDCLAQLPRQNEGTVLFLKLFLFDFLPVSRGKFHSPFHTRHFGLVRPVSGLVMSMSVGTGEVWDSEHLLGEERFGAVVHPIVKCGPGNRVPRETN